MIIYEPLAGTHIREAAKEAKQLSNQHNKPVRFTFNGVKLVMTRKKAVSSLEWEFNLVLGQHNAKHRRSKRHKEYLVKRKASVALKQYRCDRTVSRMMSAECLSIGETLNAVVTLSNDADDVDVKCDFAAIVNHMKATGFVDNAHVGRPQEVFNDPVTMAEYIIGQAIDCMKHGMPPHPMCKTFADKIEW